MKIVWKCNGFETKFLIKLHRESRGTTTTRIVIKINYALKKNNKTEIANARIAFATSIGIIKNEKLSLPTR